jgi:hypothetical protein
MNDFHILPPIPKPSDIELRAAHARIERVMRELRDDLLQCALAYSDSAERVFSARITGRIRKVRDSKLHQDLLTPEYEIAISVHAGKCK